jgi:hypothetical protein
MLREEHKLMVLESSVLSDQLKKMRLLGHVACMGERRSACGVLVGKPERKKPHRRLGLVWLRTGTSGWLL